MENENSSVNQDIKSKLVARDVYCHVGSLMEDRGEEFHVGSLMEDRGEEFQEELYACDNFSLIRDHNYTLDGEDKWFSGSSSERDELVTELEEKRDELDPKSKDYDEKFEMYLNAIEALNDAEEESAEIYEWWAVSSWLAGKLQAEGEVIYEAGLTQVWGRQSSGQAILLDGVISDIAKGMCILEGQENDWSKQGLIENNAQELFSSAKQLLEYYGDTLADQPNGLEDILSQFKVVVENIEGVKA